MGRNRLTVDFDGFDVIAKRLDELGGNVKKATEDALKASHKLIEKNVTEAMQPHIETGKTEQSIIKTANVEWTGETAAVDVGFDISNGGLASIFLMYGTQLHGQPHIEPDRKLYNAVYGTQTRKEIKDLQKEIFMNAIERVMG